MHSKTYDFQTCKTYRFPTEFLSDNSFKIKRTFVLWYFGYFPGKYFSTRDGEKHRHWDRCQREGFQYLSITTHNKDNCSFFVLFFYVRKTKKWQDRNWPPFINNLVDNQYQHAVTMNILNIINKETCSVSSPKNFITDAATCTQCNHTIPSA